MKLLLDTNAFMWWDSKPANLSVVAFQAISDPANEVWISPVSIWEVQIKNALGKLPLRDSLSKIVAAQLIHGLRELPIHSSHALALDLLPAVHKDPFDRMLAAQSIVEQMTLVTSDAIFQQYPVTVLW